MLLTAIKVQLVAFAGAITGIRLVCRSYSYRAKDCEDTVSMGGFVKPIFVSILRYGVLLALFLIVLDAAKKSYITSFTSLEFYMGLVAVCFLAVGFLVSRRFVKRQSKGREIVSLSIVDKADFSERELDVLLFVCHGYSNKEIAEHLLITTNTVKTHLKNIYRKLGVGNRTQAAAEAKLLNIIG